VLEGDRQDCVRPETGGLYCLGVQGLLAVHRGWWQCSRHKTRSWTYAPHPSFLQVTTMRQFPPFLLRNSARTRSWSHQLMIIADTATTLKPGRVNGIAYQPATATTCKCICIVRPAQLSLHNSLCPPGHPPLPAHPSISNRDPYDSKLESWRFRTLAAPGVEIRSTGAQGKTIYKSGTSMAAPMVAGIAARCFAAGDCKLGDAQAGGGALNMQRILSAAKRKATYDPEFAWNGGDGTTAEVPRVPGTKGYYGLLAWAGRW